jgi:hypothetical protein
MPTGGVAHWLRPSVGVGNNAMWDTLVTGYEVGFLIRIGLSLVSGLLIGIERESRGKPAVSARISI